MAPRTRSAAKRKTNVSTNSLDSGSDSEALRASNKRKLGPESSEYTLAAAQGQPQSASTSQVKGGVKTDTNKERESTHTIPVSRAMSGLRNLLDPAKNAHLKGRKRFIADFQDMQEVCKEGYEKNGLKAEQLRPGDDDGSLEFKLLRNERNMTTITLLVSDTSEYPKNHTFFASCQDSDVPAPLSQVLDDLFSWGSRTIQDTVTKLLTSVSQRLKSLAEGQDSGDEAQDEDDEDDEDYDVYDDELDHHFGSIGPQDAFKHQRLQHDFLEIVAADYRPGMIRFGIDDFALSVSIPVISLGIPGRALMAWDRRLLSSTQHLTLLMSGFQGIYPPLKADGTYRQASRPDMSLAFKVGLTGRYKPSKQHTREVIKNFALLSEDDEVKEPDHNQIHLSDVVNVTPVEDEDLNDPGRFERFSLSASLESLLDHTFMQIIPLRLHFGLGWAGAEALLAEVEKSQQKPADVYPRVKHAVVEADKGERKLARTYQLPLDPILNRDDPNEINLPLLAFSYLIRRLTLCTQYCLVCHNKLNKEYEALKPYVCDSNLCVYQYYMHNRGPSLEYEIRTNPVSVDMLVSLAYVAAAEGVLDDPLPTGLGLRVPLPRPDTATLVASFRAQTQLTAFPATYAAPQENALRANVSTQPPRADLDGLVDFDKLDICNMRACIIDLIDTLPPILEMKQHLEKKVKVGKTKPKLRDIDSSVTPAAWTILRWCIASCTAHLEELTADEDLVRNIGSAWRQFRFSVGAPDAEAKFKNAVQKAQESDHNARTYPSLYAFHGSPVKNWHSIIRHGLWFKTIANGRAYGNGVYFAKDGSVSMGHYAGRTGTVWKNSEICPTNCVALAELVNLPSKFISTNPFFVVGNTEWIFCRYLLVKTRTNDVADPSNTSGTVAETPPQPTSRSEIPFVKLDPAHPLSLNTKSIAIPEPTYQIQKLLADRRKEYREEDYDEDDSTVFEAQHSSVLVDSDAMDIDDFTSPSPKLVQKAVDDWQHDPEWVNASISHLMPPPTEATPMATVSIQRELKAMLQEQERARSLRELGWYMPPDLVGDNLFQWIVELHSFEKELPIARDMAAKGLNSLIFEIRFPPSFPHSPPFFRIIKPRFLPFIQGGGGHVTGGGSMCMDLLTADGWLPSYSISAVLLQIRLAISNLDPRPARLANNWDTPYAVREALEGYKRAAVTHGWQIPAGLDALVR